MTTTTYTFKYFDLGDLRNIIDVEDALDDPVLKSFGKMADDDIDAEMSTVAGALPLTGDNLTKAKSLALFKAASLWKGKKDNKDLAVFYDNQYKAGIKALKEAIAKQYTSRTKRVSVSTDYVTELTNSQTRKF